MRLIETKLSGAYLIEPERVADDRGFFARTFCRNEFAAAGLKTEFVQCNVSYNAKRHTLRGMHYQLAPHGEDKLIRCTMGAIHDVIVDIRPGSPTFRKYQAFELSQENRRLLYVPAGFAHGFITLTDSSEVFYQMSEFYDRSAACGLRWNDPAIGIDWPAAPSVISKNDLDYPDFIW